MVASGVDEIGTAVQVAGIVAMALAFQDTVILAPGRAYAEYESTPANRPGASGTRKR